MTTRLDKYKEHFGCQHDGEAILKSADFGEFSVHRSRNSGDRALLIRESALEICKALGIKPKMPKKKIVRKLQDYRTMGSQDELIDVIKQEAKAIRLRIRDIPRSIKLLPSSNSEDAIRAAARTNIMEVINLVIRFCEDPIVGDE